MKYRVTQRYYDTGKTSAVIDIVNEDEPKKEGSFPKYDQYQEDFTTLAAAKANVKATLAA